MPFTIDHTGIADWDSLHADDFELAVSNALAWSSLVCGFNRITEANAQEVLVRFNLTTKVFGAWLTRWPEGAEEPVPVFLTIGQVERRIGLATNASVRTKAAFNAHVVGELRRDAAVAGRVRTR